MSAAHELGRRGETLVAELLERRGWRVLHRNYRFGHKEIDLVARRGRTVAFVEVKARAGGGYGDPLEAINALKRREIETVARAWIGRHGRASDAYRFDAAGVFWPRGGPARVRYVKDAWRL
ncbi:MAG TPA: YraN family protein [Longimicrobiales bacterium]|nr:YraN family protein [Longimicrobiales bacterium]